MTEMGARITDMTARADTRTAGWEFAVRKYAEDKALHLYRKSQLADPAYKVLIPLCQESKLYPARHDREMVSVNHMQPKGFCGSCASCDARIRQAGQAGQ
jgi:hypothetical protein